MYLTKQSALAPLSSNLTRAVSLSFAPDKDSQRVIGFKVCSLRSHPK